MNRTASDRVRERAMGGYFALVHIYSGGPVRYDTHLGNLAVINFCGV